MATLLYTPRKSGYCAPSRIAGINWSHPAASGLVFAAPFRAARLLDAVSMRPVSLSGTGVITDFTRGAALQSFGSNTGATVADSPLLNPKRVTLTASVYIPSIGHGQQHQVAGKPFTAFTPPYYQYVFTYVGTTHPTAPGKIGFSAAVGGSWINATSATNTVLQSAWMRLVGVYDGSAVTLYMDGVQLATTAASGDITAYATSLNIGYANTAQNSLTGYLQDVRVYNRGWSADEVREDYRNQWAVYDQGARTYFIPAAAVGANTTDVPLTTFSVSLQAPTTLRSLISNVPTL